MFITLIQFRGQKEEMVETTIGIRKQIASKIFQNKDEGIKQHSVCEYARCIALDPVVFI